MIHSSNRNFLLNVRYSRDLYLVVTMLNRLLRSSWSILLQVAGFVDKPSGVPFASKEHTGVPSI